MIFSRKILAAAACAAMAAAAPAHADTLVINMAGWQTFGFFGNPLNSAMFATIPAGSEVTGFSYSGLSFSTSNGSFLNEFTLSVNFNEAGDEFLDWVPSETFAAGSFGPASGSWGGPTGGGGEFGVGSPFTVGGGANNLFITVYESEFDDPLGNANAPGLVDTTVAAGTLTIVFTSPVPEPSTYGLMALGLLGVAGAARRRKLI